MAAFGAGDVRRRFNFEIDRLYWRIHGGGARSNIRAGRRVCRRRNCKMLQPVATTDTKINFAAPDWKLPSRQWLAGLFAHGELGAIDRMAPLTGTPAETGAALGPVVGACLCVRRGTIEATLESANPMSVAALSNATGAGATCGVCRPALTGDVQGPLSPVHRGAGGGARP